MLKFIFCLQNFVLLFHFFTGLILMVISFIMGLIESTARANSLLKVGIFVLLNIGLFLAWLHATSSDRVVEYICVACFYVETCLVCFWNNC